MKKFAIGFVLLLAGALGYCGLPLTSVATLTVALEDQMGTKITSDASVTFLDVANQPIITIRSREPGSWSNSLHWWAHSSHATSKLRPRDAQRATSARIEARNCESVTIPVQLVREYHAPSIMPHGAGPAFFLYTFNQKVALRCS